jgi:hypothetical protein
MDNTKESPQEESDRKSRDRMIDRLAEFSTTGKIAITESLEEETRIMNRDAARKFLDREVIPWLMGMGSATEADAKVAMYQGVAQARLEIIRDMGDSLRRFRKQTSDLRRRLMRLSPPLCKRVLLKWRDWEVGIQMKADPAGQTWGTAMSRIHLIDSIMKESELPKKEPK